MVPLASHRTKYGSAKGSCASSHMLSLSPPFPQNVFCHPGNAVNKSLPFGLNTDSRELQHWIELAKKPEKSQQVNGSPDNFVDHRRPGADISTSESPRPPEPQRKCPGEQCQAADDGRQASSCHDLSVHMNGASDSRMTGSSNPRADQLNWLADVATGAARGPQTSSPTVSEGCEKGVRPPPHLQGADSLAGRTAYGSVLLGVSPMSQRMYSSQYHLEQLQPSSPTVGSGLSLYYSQAPRSSPYAGFYPGDHRLQYCAAIPDGLVGNRLPRPYFQGDGLYHPAMTAISAVQLQNSRTHLPHSPSYLHQTASMSPVGSAAGSPSSPHSRLTAASHAAISLLQSSRSPEDMLQQDKGHMPHPVARNSPQFQHPDDKRTSSYNCLEPKTHSPVAERTMCSSTSSYMAPEQQSSKDLSVRQNTTSPSQVHYKVPTGKEGSLKHRILRPPSINIMDPPPALQDAPLSAPPIRSTSSHYGEPPSSKHMRLDGYAGYHRSFSTSSSFALDPASLAHTQVSPSFASTCTLPAATALGGGPGHQNSQLKYPAAFMKGSIIQLANSQLKPVEHMTTEDFLECEALSPNLKIDSSTVISIEKMPASGSAKLGFAVGEKKFQIVVEAPLEHPFFVYKQGWSSCCPERSLLRYGLGCNKLKVGDKCIFLTVKSEQPSSSQNSAHSPKPPTLVPTVSSAAGTSDHQSMADSPNPSEQQQQQQSSSMISKLTAAIQLTSLQQKVKAESGNFTDGAPPTKRKRRWSFPDRISACSPPSS